MLSQITKVHPTFKDFFVREVFHKYFSLIQKLKTHFPFVKNVIYHSPRLNISYCSLIISSLFAKAKPKRDEIQQCIQLFKPSKLNRKSNGIRNDPQDSDLIPLTYTFHLSSLHPWLERHILLLLWVICMQRHFDYWQQFLASFFL